MKANLESKITLSPQAIAVSGITGLSSILINRILLADINPMIKYGSGILFSGGNCKITQNNLTSCYFIVFRFSKIKKWHKCY
jgi:hypothetical protein